MKCSINVLLLLFFVLAPNLYSQSRTTPENRPIKSGKRAFISVDVVPTTLKLGTSVSYTVANSPSVALRYTVLLPSQIVDEKQTNYGFVYKDPENELRSYGMGLIFNIKGRDLEGLYIGVNLDYVIRKSTSWVYDKLGYFYRLNIKTTDGIYLSPTIGYSYFIGPVGVGAELGAQIKTSGDANSVSNDTFYTADAIAPMLRFNIGLGL